MTEYITKEQARELIRNHILGCAMLPSPEYTFDDLFHDMCWDLNHIPPADVVEVVRCKDCRYFTPQAGWGGGQCSYLEDKFEFSEVLMLDDDYCSDGERMDGGENDA